MGVDLEFGVPFLVMISYVTLGAVCPGLLALAFQTLLDNFHVQQPQEPTAETEAECFAGLGLEFKAGSLMLSFSRASRSSLKSWPSLG